jgi:hypothetical protein
MPLIDCPECGIEVSSQASSCPRCAFPMKKVGNRGARGALGLPKVPLTSLDVTKSIVGRLMFAGLLFASGIGFDAPPVIILSLAAGGSAVPLYLKARRVERLGGVAAPKRLEQQLERQLIEAKDQSFQQLAEIDRNANHIAELEERLEFMERLLARQREQE